MRRAGRGAKRSPPVLLLLVQAAALGVLNSPPPVAEAPPEAPQAGSAVQVQAIEPGAPNYDPRFRRRPLPPAEGPNVVPRPGRPTNVVIPAIGVDSSVIKLGLNPDRTLEVPSDYQIAGWYTGSARPGELGPMVIVGHVDSYRGPGVFFLLSELRLGDKVLVRQAGGTTVRYVVERVARYPKAEFPTDLVYGSVEYPALRLITCGGVFDYGSRHYVDNVIVFARLG